jgi:multisubunit Na+/H+ antiporter MnhF subunit
MNEWEIVAAVLAVGLVPCGVLCALGKAGDALVAVELSSTLVVTILMALSEGLQRQPFLDLALTLAFVSLVGGLVVARLLERDL